MCNAMVLSRTKMRGTSRGLFIALCPDSVCDHSTIPLTASSVLEWVLMDKPVYTSGSGMLTM